MQLLTKNGKPIINRLTKLPIYTQPVEQRINNTYKELTGLTKTQATKALIDGKINESWKNEIKEVLFTSKLAGINSSMKSLDLQLT